MPTLSGFKHKVRPADLNFQLNFSTVWDLYFRNGPSQSPPQCLPCVIAKNRLNTKFRITGPLRGKSTADSLAKGQLSSWWCHKMETFSAFLTLCEGRSLVDSPHKSQWGGALTFSLIYAWTNGWGSGLDAGDLKRHRAHYDVTVMG